MRILATAVAVCSACSFDKHVAEEVDASGDAVDAAIPDAPILLDAPPGIPCFGASWWQVCPTATPTGSMNIDLTGPINTDTADCAPLAGPNAGTVCVLAYAKIHIGATIAVTGSKPLVLLALAQEIAIAGGGTIDAASHAKGTDGPGADGTNCTMGDLPIDADGGGGYGGSYVGQGGDGASRTNVGGGNPPPAVLGVLAIRGGCAGSFGGPHAADNGGHGGGAVVLISTTFIQVDGAINASGAAGLGGNVANAGGGGGGSGGLIVLDAPMFNGSAGGRVYAAGGGGGEGEGNDGPGDVAGTPGADPDGSTNWAVGGAGATTTGGDAGFGSWASSVNGSYGYNGVAFVDGAAVTHNPGGAGGGGGASGAIVLHGTSAFGGTANPVVGVQ